MNLINSLQMLSLTTTEIHRQRIKKIIYPSCSPCSSCYLKWNKKLEKERYPFVFFPMNKKCKIKLMVVSRDPSMSKDMLASSSIRFIQDLQSFIHHFCNLNYDLNPVEFGLNLLSKGIYWTHLTKCYAGNNFENVIRASGSCLKYLDFEINILRPNFIIGFGNDIAEGLKSINTKVDFAYKDLNSHLVNIEAGHIDKKGCILPHPSGRNAKYFWNFSNLEVKSINKEERLFNLNNLRTQILRILDKSK